MEDRRAEMREAGRAQLEQAFAVSGMTYRELWIRQLCLGGDAGQLELEAYLLGVLTLGSYQHNLIAQTLNEFFMDQGSDSPTPFSELYDPYDS